MEQFEALRGLWHAMPGRAGRQARFFRRMAMAKEIVERHPPALNTLIRMVGRTVQARALERITCAQDGGSVPSLDWPQLFFHFRGPLTDDGATLSSLAFQEIPQRYRLALGRDLVIPWPWEPSRIQNAISYIGFGRESGPWTQDANHRVHLLLPIGIGLVHGGNHSIATGIANSEGWVVNSTASDLAALYAHIRFDGHRYRRCADDAAIPGTPDEYMGAIFEIGRLMVQHQVAFDGILAEDDLSEQPDWTGLGRYRVYRDGELQQYLLSGSGLNHALVKAGLAEESGRRRAVVTGQESIRLRHRHGEYEYRFEFIPPKPVEHCVRY